MKTNTHSSMESKTRLIEVMDNNIIYTLKLDGVKDYLTLNGELLAIFKLNALKPFRDGGRLRFKVRKDGADVNFYLYDLAYACYEGIIKTESFLDDLQRYFEYKSSNSLSIDHADNNIHNNTMFNLSVMERRLNIIKGAVVSKVKEPVYLNSAYFDGKYRIQMLFHIDSDTVNATVVSHMKELGFFKAHCSDGLAAIHFICDEAESYVNCLGWLTEQRYEWAKPLKENGKWVKNDGDCWCLNIHHSMRAQNHLSKMSEDIFQTFG